MTEERLPMPEENSFFDIMKQDVGFDITPAKVDLEDTRRFTKLEVSPAQKMHLSALVQNVPSAVAEGAMAQAYFVRFPDGLPQALTKLKQGGYSTVLREHGRIVGSASLYPFATQAMILGAFTAMSVISGQFFLAQINRQLSIIQKKLDDVLQFLYNDKKAELISEIKFAQYAYENYSLIMDNEAQKIATITSLQAGKKEAIRDVEFYIKVLDDKAKGKDLEEAENESFEIKECLDLAMQLYVMTTILEVYYSQNQNQDYLDYLEKDITTYVNKCRSRILTCFSSLKGRIDEKKKKSMGKGKKTESSGRIEELLEQLSQGEEPELVKFLHDALTIAEQAKEYYLSANGDVYVKAS